MPQKRTRARIDYDSYIPAGDGDNPQQPLTRLEKIEADASERAYHLCALWFLLSNIDLNCAPESREEIGMQLREFGSLGMAVSEGFFPDIEKFTELAKLTAIGLDNRGKGGESQRSSRSSSGGPNDQ